MAVNKDFDFQANPLDKSGYHLEFQDDFEGSVLNAKNWLPYYLPHWSRKASTTARYSLPGGCLRLHIDRDQKPWCPEYDGSVRVSAFQSGCFSGPVGSSTGQHHFRSDLVVSEAQPTIKLYTPHYGYFETRLKAVPIPGYMVALWMIGFEERPEQSAEICICEIFGNEMTPNSTKIGYGLHPFGDPQIKDEFYRDTIPINGANYHIYAADWSPKQVIFFIDNVKIRTISQSPDYPMQLMLTIYEIPDQSVSVAEATAWPKIFEVDYVRGYRMVSGF
jgi:hypothetical protein